MVESNSPLGASSGEEQSWKNPPRTPWMSHEAFAELLLEAVDESLSQLKGTSPQVIYALLERSFHLNRVEIPMKVETFVEGLETMFGYAAKILEIQIIAYLNRKIGPIPKYPSEVSDLFLSAYIKAARSAIPE
ncbi:MAG: hypothetical protein JSV35_06960 [Candidatus Bathyarchaeota archaeon]|nr:MAG: hypothetical protein JSV35_06960 [Candidatus Bathyarchaeota archaeon]